MNLPYKTKITPLPDVTRTPGTEDATQIQKVTWGPLTAVAYAVVVYFLAQIIAVLAVSQYPHLKHWSGSQANSWFTGSVVAQFWYVLLAEALTFGAIWWFIRLRKSSLRLIGWRKPRLGDPVVALAGFAVYFIAYLALLSVVTHLIPALNVDQKQDLGFQSVTSHSGLLLTFLSLVVLPPLVEETVFRGFVFTGLRTKVKPLWAAVFTSLLFASAHLQIGSGKPLLWVAALDTFTLSLVLCYLRHKTDSLWPGILLHALKNGIAFVTLFIIGTH